MQETDVYPPAKTQHDPSKILHLNLKNPAILLVNNILGNNSRTRILPGMAFVMESRELGEPLLYIVFRKNKWQIFLKNEQNTLFLWSFLPKFG